jgi:hypothetical protein
VKKQESDVGVHIFIWKSGGLAGDGSRTQKFWGASTAAIRTMDTVCPWSIRDETSFGADEKALVLEMPVESEGSGDFSAAHAIEAGDINEAEMAELGHAPLRKGAFETVFTHHGNRCHDKNTVVEIHESRSSQTALDQGAGFQPDIVAGPKDTLVFGKVFPLAHGRRVVRIVFVHQSQKPGGVGEYLLTSHR